MKRLNPIRELLRMAGTRLVIVGLFLAVQIVLILLLVYRLFMNFWPIWYVNQALGIAIIFWLVRKDEPSTYKTIWIIIIMTVPTLGGILYLLLEENPHIKRMDARINRESKKAADLVQGESTQHQVEVDSRAAGCSNYIRRVSPYHPYQNTASKYYPFGELMFEDMLAELSRAERFIFVEYFIIYKSNMWDQMIEIMLQKAEAGVDVRIIFDDLGASKLFTTSYVKYLRGKKIKVVRFNPMTPVLSLFMNNRNHRKMLVIDGYTAFNGGINIGDEYINQNSKFGVWKDAGVRLTGEAVLSFTHMFIKIWNSFCKSKERIKDHLSYKSTADFSGLSDGMIMPYDDSPLNNEQIGESVYIDILGQAKRYVYIFSPYLILSESMIYALRMAAKRGVDVRIVTPGIPDKKSVHRLSRSYYGYLLRSGVRIYEYTPGFMHAKNFVSDDEIAVVGTINLDYRSLYLHFECATLLYNTSTIKEIKADCDKTMAESREILQKQEKRGIWGGFIDAILRLLAPLM